MFFQVLSHASLLVRSGGKTLLTDPWLLGSCYWRSWWNYPPVKKELIQDLQPDAIYITHVHWDHFHGATLRKFSKQTPIIIPLERSARTWRDLKAMGFTNIIEVPHGKSYSVHQDFKLTSYQFSPWGDSAVVIEAEGVSLLNANDAKFMGAPLRQILNQHKQFDFAFRSHSSANDRICYQYTDARTPAYEDPSLYAQSFVDFMNTVRPQYAIPFASNHCFLHKDVFHLNTTVETPIRVQQYIASKQAASPNTKAPFDLKIMVSGDSWDSANGFSIAAQDWFTQRPAHLAQYLEQNQTKLETFYAQEDRTRLRAEEVAKYFARFRKAVPWFLRRSLKNKPIVFAAKYGNQADYFKVDLFTGETVQVTADIPANSIVFETGGLILRRAMALNMFSHIGISKRVAYKTTQADARYLTRFNSLLAAYEYEVLPLGKLFSLRTARVYLRRWREVVLYAHLLFGLVAGKSVRQLEAEQLAAAR